MSQTEQIKSDLAKSYQLFAALQMDDTVYTHLSARSAGGDSYFIYPFGMFFEEVRPENLIEVNFEGEIISEHKPEYNKTGYMIHSEIYKARSDVNAVFHLHTENGVAVSSLECGLLPMSQFAFLFYDAIASYEYDALVLDKSQTVDFANKFANVNNVMLENHGTISLGKTIQEAFFYAYYLEKACAVQLKAMQTEHEIIYPNAEICRRAKNDMLGFEKDLGRKMWEGLVRTKL